MAIINGTNGNDVLTGTTGNDFIYGKNGDDLLLGELGNDWLEGNAGNDTLLGDAGNDILYGGDGDDVLVGGEGKDALYGGAGSDTFSFLNPASSSATSPDAIWDFTRGQDKIEIDSSIATSFADFHRDGLSTWVAGSFAINVYFTVGGGFTLTADDFVFVNTINGTDGMDLIYGTAGNDIVYARGGNDFVYGRNGDDRLFGGDGNDWLQGDAGNDRLNGDAGNDYLLGGDGNDRLTGGEGLDWLYGGAGNDTFVFNTKADSPIDTPDVIWDFKRGEDKIQIATSSGIDSFSDFTKVGSTWFADGFAITVHTVPTLDANDFQFV